MLPTTVMFGFAKKIELCKCHSPKTGAINYNTQLGRPDKGCAIKELVVDKKVHRSMIGSETLKIKGCAVSLCFIHVFIKLECIREII